MIAGPNRDLQAAVAAGKFREDLLARINLWTFRLSALCQRHEDIEPNLEYELENVTRMYGTKVTINKEARALFLKFPTAADARWAGNFRDLNAEVTRMATLAAGARITTQIVEEEILRLRSFWTLPDIDTTDMNLESLLDETVLSQIDPFDRVQLAQVVRICRDHPTLSQAGRYLFSVSRTKKGTPNDADRLRKYPAHFGLDWMRLQTAR